MVFFTLITLQLGEVGLVWHFSSTTPQLIRVVMPAGRQSTRARVELSYPEATPGSHPVIDKTCRQLEAYEQGKDIDFSIPAAGPHLGSEFYRQVWTETGRIPRGKVGTYGQVAGNIGHPRAARAVGTALAANPFALLIPCHRVILASGELGNYSAGGTEIKRQLLAREGVLFDRRGRIMNTSVLVS
jgi:methylated-DNA-[protein]-cysteine S-methyltransferase